MCEFTFFLILINVWVANLYFYPFKWVWSDFWDHFLDDYIKYVFMFEVLISVPFFLMCLQSFAQLYIVVFFYVF